ncbi:PfkB family carbohydrate kinase [Flavobacterium sp. AS60]|uniref:PfkB family carbohydrate kinase n=1 Tax=Flavobacterium anseongense TaxID=2910677 RepID=UPI001F3DB12A|nr:PfkB family carbohydrate kinase [Flavobacterium sp. AS60]MCF6130508.1 PfkB family carbohydrate kinase [Flavobacterium sp. AS60]
MNKTVLCIGATLVDELYFCDNSIIAASSNPAQKVTSIGGVISNIAQHLALLEVNPAIITAIGNDADGVFIKSSFNQSGIDCNHSIVVNDATGKYVSILQPDGNLYVAVCQDNCGKHISATYLETQKEYLKGFDILIIDTNLESETIQWLIYFAKNHQKKLIIEPVSVAKASKLAGLDLNGVFMVTPNENELLTMSANNIKEQSIDSLFERGVETIWIRKGAEGSTLHTRNQSLDLNVPSIQIVDSTGAGDAALAAWVFGYVNGEDEKTCLQLGHTLALEILKSKGAVDASLTPSLLYQHKKKYYND